jgi:Bor protein
MIMRAAVLVLALCASCYRYSFEQRAPAAGEEVVVHKVRAPTYLNGFVGVGRIDATKYCAEPLRTQLKVTATDVMLSIATLLIYTPHTLYVTCPAAAQTAATGPRRSR